MSWSQFVTDSLVHLRPSYLQLLERVVAVSEKDDRVRALWLSGALARGVADKGSDLDLVMTVEDTSLPDFAGGWREWLASITKTVIARPLGRNTGSFYCVTDKWERLDVVAESITQLKTSNVRDRIIVLDKDGLNELVPEPQAATAPSPETVSYLVEEFFRILGLLTVVVDRQDWLLGIEGVHTLRGLLYQLFTENNKPQPSLGLKQWSAKLSSEQRRILSNLPTGKATREAAIDGHVQVAQAFLPFARTVTKELGIEWPEALEASTLSYLEGELGVKLKKPGKRLF